MKHSVRNLAALVVFGAVAVTAFGSTRYVSRSGDYEDPSIWQNGEKPSEDGTDAASIGAIWSVEAGKMIPASADVTFNSDGNKLTSVTVSDLTRTTQGDAGLYPITLFGNGNTLVLGETKGLVAVDALRKAVIDNLKITLGNTGGSGLAFKGDVTLRNGSSIADVSDSVYLNLYGTANTTIDASSMRVRYFAPYAGASLEIRHGGSLTFTTYYTAEDTAHPESILSRVNARVIDGDVSLGAKAIYTDGFLPERSGTAIAQQYYPSCATGGTLAHRLGGTLRVDSGDTYGLVATNSAYLYGDGKLFVGTLSGGGFESRFDLSGVYMRAAPSDGRYIFGDGIAFGYCGTKTNPSIKDAAYGFTFEGATRLLTTNVLSGTTLSSFTLGGVGFNPGSGVSIIGGGTMYLTPGYVSDMYAKYEVGDNTTVYNYADWWETLLAHDFKMGANATLASRNDGSYFRNVPTVVGAVEIDPTATIKVYYKNMGQRFFASIDDVAAPQVGYHNPDSVPEGCGLLHVEGSYYLATNGFSKISSQHWCCWKGGQNGLWSNKDNWQTRIPGVTQEGWGAHFACVYDGVNQVSACVTNNCDNLTLPHLYALSSAGPHIIRGNTITLTSGLKNTQGARSSTAGQPPTGSAIVSYSPFPFIVEAPVKATGEYFGVVSGGDGKDISTIALKGDVEADGVFAPSGHVVVDGKVTAADLELNPIMANAVDNTYKSKNWRGTVLLIRNGGEVEVTNPTTAQTTGMVWIAKGGKLTINGDFNWADASMIHKVDGTLAVAGKLGGTGVEKYYGKGSVEIAGIAAGTTAKFGQGVTLAPTDATAANWAGVIAVDGKMKFAPSTDWTLPSTLTVARPGSVLEFAGSRYTILTGAPAGADYDIAVSGKLAIADDMTVPFATFKPGATLAFMRKGDGTIPVLTVDGDVDLTGVALTGYSDEDSAAMRKTVILKVARGRRIVGVPSETDHFKFAVVENADGGYSLAATRKQGLLIIMR